MDILPQLILNSVIAGAIYGIVALGFNLIYGATKFFNLSHGVIAVAGAYGFLFFSKTLGLNLFLSVLIGVDIAAIIGYGLDKLVYLPLRKERRPIWLFLSLRSELSPLCKPLSPYFLPANSRSFGRIIPPRKYTKFTAG